MILLTEGEYEVVSVFEKLLDVNKTALACRIKNNTMKTILYVARKKTNSKTTEELISKFRRGDVQSRKQLRS